MLDAAYLERQRDRVSPAEYAAEVLGEWSDAQGSLFPRELLERCTADYELPTLATLHGSAQPMLGVDWGVSFDRSAAVAIGRLPVANLNPDRPARPTFGAAAVEVWPQGTPLAEVVSDLLASPCPVGGSEPRGERRRRRSLAGSARTPASSRCRCEEQRPRPVPSGRRRVLDVDGADRPAERRQPRFDNGGEEGNGLRILLTLLEQERLVLPRHPDLLRQLAALRFEQSERGVTRIEADSPGIHDDVADALMLASAPFSRHGRARCRLARFARLDIPEADVPAATDTVTTGGGLVLPRTPFWQSVNRPEVTIPAALLPEPEPHGRNPVLERAREYLTTRS